MDVFLSINNRAQVIQLPVVPEKFKISTEMNNQAYETVSQGEIKLIGLPKLSSVTLESFFPAGHKDYGFSRDDTHSGWEYVNVLETWKQYRIPVRLVISDTSVNMACTIDTFEYGIQDGSGDIYYTLGLSEFKFVNLE